MDIECEDCSDKARKLLIDEADKNTDAFHNKSFINNLLLHKEILK